MKRRKIFAIITVLAMVFGAFSMSFAEDEAIAPVADDETVAPVVEGETVAPVAEEEIDAPLGSASIFSDVTDHWGKEAIEKWSGFGIINGYEGFFRPDDSITRGEFAVILDNMMDYQVAAQNNFGDLPAGQFYTDAVLKANAAGIIQGYDGSVRPTEKITKEEAAVLFSRAFAVEEAGSTKAFLDASAVSDWAKDAVFGLEAKSYISGFDGYFNPKASITRAEVVTIINNIVKAYYTAAGTYTDDVNGTAVIKAAGVVIKDAVIDGDVIIAEGVADGNVTFDGKAAVKGDLVVRGGGENSVIITGDANVQSVTVEKVGGKVRILADGVVIGEVKANEEVILEGTFKNVTIAADAAVVIKGNVTKLDLEEKGSVDIQSGTVTTLNIPAGATANVAASATVKTANVTGAADIKGTGKIESAVISGTGATIAQTPTKVEVKEGGKAEVGGNTVTSETTPSTGGGGGGSDSSSNNPTFSLGDITVSGHGTANQVPRSWTGTTTMQAIVSGTNLANKALTVEVSATLTPSAVAITRTYDYTVVASPTTASAITFNSSSDNAEDFVTSFDVGTMISADWNTLKTLDIVNDTVTIKVKYGSTVLATKTFTIVN